LLVALFVNLRVRDSRLGRAWVALREDEVAAVSMGIPLVRTKLLRLGSIWGAVTGGLLLGYINNWLIPDVLDNLPSAFGPGPMSSPSAAWPGRSR